MYLGLRDVLARGTLSSALALLTSLEYLSVARSDGIGGTVPPLPPRLTHLTITNTRLTAMPPLRDVPLLESLTVSGSRLQADLADFLRLTAPHAIETLTAARVPGLVGALPAALFANAVNLTQLVLTDVGIVGELPSELAALPAVRQLRLRALRDVEPRAAVLPDLSPLVNLTALTLSAFAFVGTLPSSLLALTLLRTLDLSDNPRLVVPAAALPPSLVELNLRNTRFVGGSQLGALRALTRLVVQQPSDAPPLVLPSELGNCTALRGACSPATLPRVDHSRTLICRPSTFVVRLDVDSVANRAPLAADATGRRRQSAERAADDDAKHERAEQSVRVFPLCASVARSAVLTVVGTHTSSLLSQLSTNRFSSLPTLSLPRTLTTLNLSTNAIDALPAQFNSTPQLATLDVSGNLLRTLPPSVANLSALVTLLLARNPLASLPSLWPGLAALQRLSLRNIGRSLASQREIA